MSPPLHQPHDHLFRLVFADPEETAAFLRARLPDSYQRGILWSSLSRAPGSFRRPRAARLRHRPAVRGAQRGRGAAAVALTCCSNISPSPTAGWRCDCCATAAASGRPTARDYPDEQYLRPVLPLVFYQGEHHWHYDIELAESFPPALRGQPWVPRFCPLLLDQTRMAPAAVEI